MTERTNEELTDDLKGVMEHLWAQGSRIDELESTFRHIHESGEIKGWISDKCAKCGLDLRDDIHERLHR